LREVIDMTGRMRPGFATLAFVCLIAACASPARAEEQCSTPPFSADKLGAVVTITVDWKKLRDCTVNEKGKGLGARIGRRINEDNPVNIHVTNFNFINYTVSYKVEETVVETYVMLEKLWQQLLGIPLFGTPSMSRANLRAHERAVCKGFQQCGANWAFKIATVQIVLGEFLEEFAGQTHVTEGNKTTIKNHAAELKAHQKDIRDLLKVIVDNPGNVPTTIPEVGQFETVFGKQEKLFEKIDAYLAAADLVENGKTYPVGKKKTGTIVAVSLTPKDQSQADGKPTTTTEYFVHSKLPVVFHAGYSYSKLKDVEFETVRSLEQTDLFSEIRKNTETLNTMVAFLSLGRSFLVDEKVGAFLSIGTDFSNPGDRLYVGASAQVYKRFFFTVGKLNATVTEGVNPVLERVGNATDSRELFTAIATRRDWSEWFYSVSFKVF
jgi:hypothetical protein